MTVKQQARVRGMVSVLPVVALSVLIAFGPVVFASIAPHAAPLLMAADTPVVGPATPQDWPAAVGTLSVSGVLIWYLWYTTSVSSPKEREAFRLELAAEREAASELAATRGAQIEKLCDRLGALATELQQRPCIYKSEGK